MSHAKYQYLSSRDTHVTISCTLMLLTDASISHLSDINKEQMVVKPMDKSIRIHMHDLDF